MGIALKIITLVGRILVIALLLLTGYLFYQFKFANATQVTLGSITVVQSDDAYQLVLSRGSAGYMKGMTDKLNEVIYDQAGKHNPEGDLLPDQLDDKVKQEVKEGIKQKIKEEVNK